MSEPYGPIKISANRQIALPKALLDRLRLRVGDMVYVAQSDVEPDGLIVLPVERVSEWIRLGRSVAEQHQAQGSLDEVQDDG